MAEFFSMDEDWDLQAIVRGCSDDHSKNIQNYRDDFLFNFPDVYEANNINNNSVLVDELDDIYKPFYPIYNSFSTQAHIVTPSNSFPEEVNLEPEEIEKVLDKEIVVDQSAKTVAHAAKYKRSCFLNQEEPEQKVMVEVTAEGLSSDLWAWRKYGQKPIKGSPYPRSYYRCSSSKGCLARKQVEQSCTDPGMFIINYSGEHNHSQPTRRSSLAGTNRHKFSVPKKMTSSSDSCTAATTKEESSCSPPSYIVMFSPTTPLMPSIEEVLTLQQSIKNENSTIGEEINIDVEFVIPDIMINDDFFVGLEELDGLISDSVFYTCSTQQFQ